MHTKKKTINNCTSTEFNLNKGMIYINDLYDNKIKEIKERIKYNTHHYLNQNLCYRYFPKDTYLRHINIYLIKTLAHIQNLLWNIRNSISFYMSGFDKGLLRNCLSSLLSVFGPALSTLQYSFIFLPISYQCHHPFLKQKLHCFDSLVLIIWEYYM